MRCIHVPAAHLDTRGATGQPERLHHVLLWARRVALTDGRGRGPDHLYPLNQAHWRTERPWLGGGRGRERGRKGGRMRGREGGRKMTKNLAPPLTAIHMAQHK